MKDQDIYKDRESQIAAIEKTFEKAKIPVSLIVCKFTPLLLILF